MLKYRLLSKTAENQAISKLLCNDKLELAQMI